VIRIPLIRKLVKVGTSKAVTIPPSWLAYYERKNGDIIKEVFVEVNGKLTIRPILKGRLDNKSKNE
jgi:antitoxin component of MazEF toxin-antitoxin module